MTDRITVMISSTALDLPDHRKEVMEACLRQGMFPTMMEHLPAVDAEAIAESRRMVDAAGIYIGVFAHRYGYVPKGQDISITEMEYNRAVERGIPRLFFLMHEDHPLKASDVEKGDGAVKLEKLKAHLATERVVNFFKSPADLRAHVINSLSRYREPDKAAFHYVSDIPAPPETYIAHPYTLLQTRDLIGRQNELNLLTDWVARPRSAVYQARIFNVVAIGGMGKSALTWKWFNDIAPNEMKPLAGRMWWSFYESDATFENFIIRALAYVSGRAREDIEKNTKPGEREELLLTILNREPFLLVLDGLERILIAYARMDANRLADDDLDQRTANVVAGRLGLPEGAAQSFIGQHRLRKTADPRAGNFLRKLARVQSSRVLVSTRLYPADLQNVIGEPLPGSLVHFVRGLSDDDALHLWRTFGVSGSRDELLRLFHIFGSHPLLIQALAGEIAHYHRAPGDFDIWRSNHPDFNPFSLPLVQARSHILEFALRGLNEPAKRVLHTVAPFRMPATYDTLAALLIGEDKKLSLNLKKPRKQGRKSKFKDEFKIFSNENELDVALMELEDRGLLGWDKRGNRYDLHPIVRGVVWAGLSNEMRRDVYTTLHAHFEAMPKIEDDLQVESLEDLTPAIELYNTLIGLGRYDDAVQLFYDCIEKATLYRLSASRQRVELLEMLFPDGLDQLPRLSNPVWQAVTLSALAAGYHFSGQPGHAVPLVCQQNAIQEREGDQKNLSVGLKNLSGALLQTGTLSESQLMAFQSLVIERKRGDLWSEGTSLEELGWILATRGLVDAADRLLQRALQIFSVQEDRQAEGVVNASIAKLALWKADHAAAFLLANRAWELANVKRVEWDFIRAARLQGAASLGLNDLARADERLHHALTRARAVNFVEEELPALIALAELRRQQGDSEAARELLEAVWEAAERGPYPLFHADALNVLAQIELDAGNTSAAIEAATQAYRKAWCDGPPFAYHWGLIRARAHLNALGAPEPLDLPPYDESKHEPMPEVDIDPPDAPEDEE
jgi:tetratricopeptide (TPR) repeat protein